MTKVNYNINNEDLMTKYNTLISPSFKSKITKFIDVCVLAFVKKKEELEGVIQYPEDAYQTFDNFLKSKEEKKVNGTRLYKVLSKDGKKHEIKTKRLKRVSTVHEELKVYFICMILRTIEEIDQTISQIDEKEKKDLDLVTYILTNCVNSNIYPLIFNVANKCEDEYLNSIVSDEIQPINDFVAALEKVLIKTLKDRTLSQSITTKILLFMKEYSLYVVNAYIWYHASKKENHEGELLWSSPAKTLDGKTLKGFISNMNEGLTSFNNKISNEFILQLDSFKTDLKELETEKKKENENKKKDDTEKKSKKKKDNKDDKEILKAAGIESDEDKSEDENEDKSEDEKKEEKPKLRRRKVNRT